MSTLQQRTTGEGLAPTRRALARCVAEPAEFAAAWGQRLLHAAATELPRGFDDLLDLDGIDELLSRRGLRTPFLRMAKEGVLVPPSSFTRSGGVGATVSDQVDSAAVARLFADGTTIVLQALHRVWPPLVDFAAELSADLGHPVQINAYVTPPSSRGFSAHYDVHDVFVLQLAGEKRWIVHRRRTRRHCGRSRGPTDGPPSSRPPRSRLPSTSSCGRVTPSTCRAGSSTRQRPSGRCPRT